MKNKALLMTMALVAVVIATSGCEVSRSESYTYIPGVVSSYHSKYTDSSGRIHESSYRSKPSGRFWGPGHNVGVTDDEKTRTPSSYVEGNLITPGSNQRTIQSW